MIQKKISLNAICHIFQKNIINILVEYMEKIFIKNLMMKVIIILILIVIILLKDII